MTRIIILNLFMNFQTNAAVSKELEKIPQYALKNEVIECCDGLNEEKIGISTEAPEMEDFIEDPNRIYDLNINDDSRLNGKGSN